MSSLPNDTTTRMTEDPSNAKNPEEPTSSLLPSTGREPRYNAFPSPDYPEAASARCSVPTYSQQPGRIPRPAVSCNSDNVVMTTHSVDLPTTYHQHEGNKQSHSTCSGETAAATTQLMNPPLTYPQPAGNKPPLSTSSSENVVGNTQSMKPPLTNPQPADTTPPYSISHSMNPPPYPGHAGSNRPQAVYYQGGGEVVTTQPAMTTVMRTHGQTNEKDYLRFSIVNLLCCCLILGIAALVFSIKTKEANARGQQLKAKKYSTTALSLNISSFIIGIIVNVVWITIYITVYLDSGRYSGSLGKP